MPADQARPDSNSPTRKVVRELQGLIQSLLGLYSQISSRLLNSRIETRHESATGRDGLPIEELLTDHIERNAAEPSPPEAAVDVDGTTASHPASAQDPSATAEQPGRERSGLGLFGALSSYFGRHPSSAHTVPYLHEKMRKNTLDHINKALVLTRQGDAMGAKVHAGLADSAMQTAGEYMTDEEYVEFKAEVEARLQAIRQPRD